MKVGFHAGGRQSFQRENKISHAYVRLKFESKYHERTRKFLILKIGKNFLLEVYKTFVFIAANNHRHLTAADADVARAPPENDCRH